MERPHRITWLHRISMAAPWLAAAGVVLYLLAEVVVLDDLYCVGARVAGLYLQQVALVLALLGLLSQATRWRSALTLVLMLLAFSFLPMLWTPRRAQRLGSRVCRSNLKQLGIALAMYAEDHDGCLPPTATVWEAALRPYYHKDGRLLGCPSDDQPPSYQLNPYLAGRRLDGISTPERVVAIFESDDGRTVVDRHGYWFDPETNLCFLDGHVEARDQHAGAGIIWKPPRTVPGADSEQSEP